MFQERIRGDALRKGGREGGKAYLHRKVTLG